MTCMSQSYSVGGEEMFERKENGKRKRWRQRKTTRKGKNREASISIAVRQQWMRQAGFARATTTESSIGSCDWPGECEKRRYLHVYFPEILSLRLVRQIEWSIEV